MYQTPNGVVQAVRDVDLDLHAGEKLALVGESGSGKSAFALSLMRLLEPPGAVVGGSITLNGTDLLTLPERELRKRRGAEIALIYQDPMGALDPVRSVGHQIADALVAHDPKLRWKEIRKKAIELLDQVELPKPDLRLRDYPHQYSGGMRQRVVIAMALANDPAVLIADEPTTALDVTTQAQILDLLKRLVSERGSALILITHNLGVVAGFADLVCVMYAGRFVERASVARVLSSPRHPYTAALLNCSPWPGEGKRDQLESIPGTPPDLIDLPRGCSFEPRCPVGRGEARCRSEFPPRVVLGPDSAFSECHFADQPRGVRAGVGT